MPISPTLNNLGKSYTKAINYAETAFPQNFHIMKLSEITAFLVVLVRADSSHCKIMGKLFI